MEGEREGPQRGIIPRAVEDIFTCIESDTATGSKYLVRASYLQIYNEVGHIQLAALASGLLPLPAALSLTAYAMERPQRDTSCVVIVRDCCGAQQM